MDHAASTDDFSRKYRQLCRQAEQLAEVKRWSEARKIAQDAIRLNPTDHYAYCLYSYLLTKSDTSRGGLREALDYAEKGIRYRPEDEWGYRLRSVCLRQLGDIPAAIEAAREAVRYDPYESKTHYVLGWALIEAQAFTEAEAVSRHLVELAPEWSSSFYLLGSVALKRGRNAEAEIHFRRALELEPDAPYLLNDLAVAVERQGRKAEAVELYSLALKLSPESELYRENVRQGVKSQIDKNPAVFWHAVVIGVGVAAILLAVRMTAVSGRIRLGLALAGTAVAFGGAWVLGEKLKRLKATLNPVAAAVYDEAQKKEQQQARAQLIEVGLRTGLALSAVVAILLWIGLAGKALGGWALIGVIAIIGAAIWLWMRIPNPDSGKKN